jgi:hypothetical protein
MKKIIVVLAIACIGIFASCNGAHNKTGGATRDSSASHGNSGPADADTVNGSQVPTAQSTNGSDTSTTGKPTDEPTVDTSKPKKH